MEKSRTYKNMYLLSFWEYKTDFFDHENTLIQQTFKKNQLQQFTANI